MLTGTAMHRQRVTDSRISTAFFTEVRYCRHSVMLCPFDGRRRKAMKKTIKKLTAVMLAVAMVLTFIPILGSQAVYADEAAALDPVSISVKISDPSDGVAHDVAHPGDRVTYTMTIINNSDSPNNRPVLYLKKPQTGELAPAVRLSRIAETDSWIGTFTINVRDESGDWRISSVELYSSDGSIERYTCEEYSDPDSHYVFFPHSSFMVDTGGGTLSIQLVDDGTVPNIKGAQVSSIWFGNYQLAPIPQSGDRSPEPVKWRVLENADKRLFLLSDQNLDCQKYNETASFEKTWADSSIRTWLNNEFIPAVFSDKEGAYCVMSSLVVNDDNPEYGDNYPAGVDTTDSVFLLSIGEATNASYGFTDNVQPTIIREAKNTEYAKAMGASTASGSIEDDCNGSWWLRTPGVRGNAAYVSYDGQVETYGINVEAETIAVRPAFNLDLTSVLFASAATGGKVSGDVGAESLTAVPYNSSGEWKLTLKNERYYGDIGFDASAASGATLEMNEGYSDWSIPVVYSGAKTGDNEYVSVILCDSDGTAKYYGNIARNSAASSDTGQAVTIPEGLAAGEYTMNIFNEQINGDRCTDYATDFSTIELTVKDPQAGTCTVTFDPAGGTWKDGTTAAKKVTVEKGGAAEAPEELTRSGYDFAGWFDGEDPADITNITSDLTVTAKWKENTTPPEPPAPGSIKGAKVVLSKTAFTYNAKVQKPSIKTIGGKVLTEGSDYTATWSNRSSKNAGSYTVTITGKGNYTGTTKATYKINKAANPLKIGPKTATVKFSKLKKANQKLAVTKVIKFTKKASDKKTYIKKSGNKKIIIAKKTGKVTVKKGLQKGTYTMKVKVKALGNANYNASKVKTVTFTVRVK